MPESRFDEWIAERYEALWPELFEPSVLEPAVEFLATLVGTGDALEFGIGTGRVALPLSQRGIRVHGIELSPSMVAQLRTRPGGPRDRRHGRRLRNNQSQRQVHARLLAAQHDHEPHQPT